MDNDDSGGVAGADDEPSRCQMVHREVDDGLEHRDAMNAHQSARNRCFGTSKDIVVVLTAHSCSRRMDVSIDTTHFRLTSRRHGWNMSQSASDRKG